MDRIEEEIKKLANHFDDVERAKDEAVFEKDLVQDELLLLQRQLGEGAFVLAPLCRSVFFFLGLLLSSFFTFLRQQMNGQILQYVG